MNTIPELIAYFELTVTECDRQLDRLNVMQPTRATPESTIDKWIVDYTDQRHLMRDTASYLSTLHSLIGKPSFQDRVAAAHVALFAEDPTDIPERAARFFEESNETCQAFGMTREEAHALVDYTYGRPAGEQAKEVGSAMLTLASLCVVAGFDLAAAGEADLEKLQRPETIERIRAKRTTRHGRGPLPGIDPVATEEEAECCEACGVRLEEGDLVYWAIDAGYLHAECCGPERESYCGPDGEPLQDDEPIPEPAVWSALR